MIRHFQYFLLVCLSLVCFEKSANAGSEEWPKLPDGRVVIEIYGEKIALSTSEYDLKNTVFHIFNEEAKKLIPIPQWTAEKAAKGLTRNYSDPVLEDILAHPKEARAAFEKAKDSSNGIWIRVGPPETGSKRLVQGKFNPSKLGNSQGTHGGIYTIQIRNYEFDKEKQLSCKFISLKTTKSYGIIHKDSTLTTYCIPAEERFFKTQRPLTIGCISIGDESPSTCRSYYVNQKGTIQASYAFLDAPIANSTSDSEQIWFPQEKWKELDLQMHEFFSYFLINKAGGELQ